MGTPCLSKHAVERDRADRAETDPIPGYGQFSQAVAGRQHPDAVTHGVALVEHAAHVVHAGGKQTRVHNGRVDHHQAGARGQVEGHAIRHLVDASGKITDPLDGLCGPQFGHPLFRDHASPAALRNGQALRVQFAQVQADGAFVQPMTGLGERFGQASGIDRPRQAAEHIENGDPVTLSFVHHERGGPFGQGAG